MYLEEFGFNNKNLNKILYRLQKVHGTKLDLSGASIDELVSIYEHYSKIKSSILQESHYNSYHSHPEYAKAILICEAIRIFLSEIAPGRKGKKVVRKKKVAESILMELEASEEGKRRDPNLQTEPGVDRPLTTMSATRNFTDVDPFDYELKPEVKMVDKTNDYSADAGQDFDGNDLTSDYEDDRDPSMDGSPHTSFDYEDEDKWIEDKFLIEPEIGDEDESSEVTGEEPGSIDSEVAKRYYDTPGPDASDYADDRNIEAIDGMMDGPGYHNEKGDVVDQLEELPEPPGEETKTGLPSELEYGFRSQPTPTQKNGVVDHDFHQDPRTKDDEREVPDPNDLQSDNNKKMYEQKLASAMIAELNCPRSFGKIFEAAELVATSNNVHVADVLNAFESGARQLTEYNDPDDPVYNQAMLYVLELIGDERMRKFLLRGQAGGKAQERLKSVLINKANEYGLDGKEAKRFVFAVLNSILSTDLSKFRTDRPVWEN